MRVRFQLVGSAVLVLLAVAAAGAQQKAQAPGRPEDNPGPVHKQMARRAGEYTLVSKFVAKEGTPVQESKGTAKITSVLDGRFLLEENSSELLNRPFTGLRLYGYNNASGKYEGFWTYTGSTAIMRLSG